MFDDEEYEQNDEMAPEEESFPVDEDKSNGHEKSLSELRQKSGTGSKKDGDNLRNTIDKNKTKNAGSNVAKNAANAKKNSDNQNKNDEENPDDGKSSKEAMAQDAASEAAKTAASTAMQAAGVPKGIADKVSQKVVDSEQGQKLINDTIKKIKDQKKKMILKLLIPAIPYVLGLFVAVFAVLMVMTQMMAIAEKVEGAFITVSTGLEKFVNFASGNGWNTEEEEFFKSLKEQYGLSLEYLDEGIDIPLVAATIHYNRGIDPEIYENDESGATDTSIGEDADTEQLFGNFVAGELAKNFYYVANDKLGSLTSLAPGQRRLIGHMVDITITKHKTYDAGEAIEGWSKFFSYYGKAVDEELTKNFNIFSWISTARTIGAYETQANDADSYAGYYIRNILYEKQEYTKAFNEAYGENNEKVDQGEGIFSYPIVNMTYNEDKFYEYLINVYIPGTYFSGHELSENEKYEVERIAREIFEQRETYNYLVDRTVEDGQLSNCKYTYSSSESATASLQGYAVDMNFVNNLKVELLPGSCGSKVSNCTDSDIVDVLSLKDYVIGVAYSEIGASLGDNEQWLKANMIAIKSYTLNKNKGTLRLEDGQYYIKMINNTYQQTYCSVEDGCMERTSNRKPALSEEAKNYLKTIYDSIASTFLYTKSGTFIGSYRADYSMCVSSGIAGSCMGQNDSEDDADTGLDYQNILGKYYTQDIGLIDVSKGTMLASVYQCYSSGLAAGKHGNTMIRTSIPVSTDRYYNQPYVSNSNRGQCVWYVKGRASEIVATSVTDPAIQDKLLSVLRNATGNGNQWYNATLQSVFGSSSDYTKPKAGSIGVYDWTNSRCVSYWNARGKTGCKEKYGHAIIIEDVDEVNQTVTYTDGYTSTGSCPSNWNCVNFRLHENIPISQLQNLGGGYIFIGYIYLLD